MQQAYCGTYFEPLTFLSICWTPSVGALLPASERAKVGPAPGGPRGQPATPWAAACKGLGLVVPGHAGAIACSLHSLVDGSWVMSAVFVWEWIWGAGKLSLALGKTIDLGDGISKKHGTRFFSIRYSRYTTNQSHGALVDSLHISF